MYDRIIQHTMNFLYAHSNAAEEDRDLYHYGFELILMYFINAGALLLLGLLMGCFFETLLLLFGFALQQSFAGGFHAMTHLRCFLIMLAGWAASMLLIRMVVSYPVILGAMAAIGVFVVFLFAPVKHENYPVSAEKERKMKRIAHFVAILMCIVVFIDMLLFPNNLFFANVLGVTLLMSALSILYASLKGIIQNKDKNLLAP